jgi:uncharacterized protein (DUF2141 family)
MENKINAYFFMFVLLVLGTAVPTTALSESMGKLTVNISGFPSSEGVAMVALHNSERSYQGEEAGALDKKMVPVVNQKTQVVFGNLAFGSYGVSLYHDENANGKLDTNAMGIPKEAYGFSNNARSFFGKPGYKDVMFQMNSAEKKITIEIE